MKQSEYIVWKCETIEEIRTQHPDWKHEQIMDYFDKVEDMLKSQGLITKDWE